MPCLYLFVALEHPNMCVRVRVCVLNATGQIENGATGRERVETKWRKRKSRGERRRTQLSAVDKKKSDNYICEKATTMIAAKRDNKKL